MIYVHVPFCHSKCIYCAFYSLPSQKLRVVYLDAILKEIEQRSCELRHPVKTLYFGGGTPSILSLEELRTIADALRSAFDLSALREATIECNPEDVSPQWVEGVQKIGLFNRISIGVQSLDDARLRRLGRRHTAADALQAVGFAKSGGFDNISIDLIFGLPGEEENLLPSAAVLQHVSHISLYALTLEENTALHRLVSQGRFPLPDDDLLAQRFLSLHSHLSSLGFEQYEVSNYCRPSRPSLHNSRYWDHTPYLGLGPAAHSFDGRSRRWNFSNVERYASALSAGKPYSESELLSEQDLLNETLMTALRTTRGLDARLLPPRFAPILQRGLQKYVDCGWLSFDGRFYCPSAEGLLHADGIAADLFIA